MPLAEAAVVFVTTKVLDYVANETIAAGGMASSERVRSWLGRDPQRLAVEVALARTELRFAESYPQWHAV